MKPVLHLCSAIAAVFIATPLGAAQARSDAGPVLVEGLPRQADPGFRTSAEGGNLVVQRLAAGSPAAEAGLQDGDEIIRVNGRKFTRPYEGDALLVKLDGGAATSLEIRRGGEKMAVAFTPAGKPLEAIPGVRSVYGSATTSDGARLRTIITIPEGSGGKLHPLLFTQWVSCGSIEYRPGSESREILAHLARESGLALIRVERATDGDSDGAECHTLDYDTEVAHYVDAFAAAMKHDAIDASRVFVNGSSLGSTTAPLVALELQKKGFDIAGVAVQGGGAETYYERMLTFDRHYLERRPADVAPAAIHDELMRRARFHYEYLVRGRSPDAVAKDSADMAKVRADILGMGDGEQYGRPYAWHQQAARRNFLAAWAGLDAPVLVIFNEFDQYEARYGAEAITSTVNRLRPGTATLVIQPGLDHGSERFETIEAAYAGEGGVAAWEETASAFADWYRARAGH